MFLRTWALSILWLCHPCHAGFSAFYLLPYGYKAAAIVPGITSSTQCPKKEGRKFTEKYFLQMNVCIFLPYLRVHLIVPKQAISVPLDYLLVKKTGLLI